MNRPDWQLVLCYHDSIIKVKRIDKVTGTISCTKCHQEIGRWHKYSEDMFSFDEELFKRIFVMGMVRELDEFEREELK